ncbi:MAG TPA: nucleotide exchange factor GrpE [Acidimicrobiia bacterium]|nr:nucleotide exchange factor GrpE [Acidimicrobiia bacterium]
MTDQNTPEMEEGLTVSPAIEVAGPGDTAHDLGVDLPEDPDEAVSMLLRLLAESREEGTSYLDDLKRVAADFDNFRKRTMREQSVVLDRAAERVIQQLLPALDSFDAALSITVESEAGKQLMTGMEKTREQLLGALAEEGLKVVPTVGEKFDPEVHEPVGAPSGEGQLMVDEELRRGYQLNDRLIRPALVTLELRES